MLDRFYKLKYKAISICSFLSFSLISSLTGCADNNVKNDRNNQESPKPSVSSSQTIQNTNPSPTTSKEDIFSSNILNDQTKRYLNFVVNIPEAVKNINSILSIDDLITSMIRLIKK